MRFSITIPNFGDFADAETVARVALAAEAAGWDDLFVWDHVVQYKRDRRSFGEPTDPIPASSVRGHVPPLVFHLWVMAPGRPCF
jgi:hypothetical protein